MGHTCGRQDAVLVSVSDPTLHSGAAYPSEVSMSRPLRAKKEKIKIYNREPQHDAENPSAKGAMTVNKQLTMVYWKGARFWLGKLLEHPDIMTQGETLEELEDNLKDAYRLLVMDDVPDDHHTKAITL